MAVKPTGVDGVQLCVSAVTNTTPTAITITALTVVTATPTTRAAVKVVSAGPQPMVGDLVSFGTVGYPSMDGKTFVATKVNAGTDFEIGNLDLGVGTLAATPTFTHWGATDMTCLCVSALSRTVNQSSPIATPHICDLTATIPGPPPAAPVWTVEGYVDVTSPTYTVMMDAALDGKQRHFRLSLPKGNGYLTFDGSVSNFADAQMEVSDTGVVKWSATITQAGKEARLWS